MLVWAFGFRALGSGFRVQSLMCTKSMGSVNQYKLTGLIAGTLGFGVEGLDLGLSF